MSTHEESSQGVARERMFVQRRRPFGNPLLLAAISISFVIVFVAAAIVLASNQLGSQAVRNALALTMTIAWIGWVAFVMRRQQRYREKSKHNLVPVVVTASVARVPFQDRVLPVSCAAKFAAAQDQGEDAAKAFVATDERIAREIDDLQAAAREASPDEAAQARGLAALMRISGCTPDGLNPFMEQWLRVYEGGRLGRQPRIWFVDDAARKPRRAWSRCELGDGRFAWRARTSERLPIPKPVKIGGWWLAIAGAGVLGAWAWQRGSVQLGLAALKWIAVTWFLIGGIVQLFRPSWWLIMAGDSLILSRSKRGHTIDEKRWPLSGCLVILHRQYTPGGRWLKPSPGLPMNWRFCVPGEPWAIDVSSFTPEGTVLERPIREFEGKTDAARNG